MFFGFERIDKNGKSVLQLKPCPEKCLYTDKSEIMNQLLPDFIARNPYTGISRNLRISAWNCCLNREFLIKNELKFVSERDYISEDVYFYIELFACLQKVSIMDTTIHLQYGGDVFLVGTKFSVIYMHFYLISFFIADKNVRLRTIRESSLNNAILVLFFIMTMIMSIELGTATGIVGTVALLLFLWLNEKNIGFFLNSKSFFVALLASLLFAVFVEIILSNSVVTYIITQLLGKDVTLTFRSSIKRIICPAENAYERIEAIKNSIRSNVEKDTLILGALF